jgi:hypothetical protein
LFSGDSAAAKASEYVPQRCKRRQDWEIEKFSLRASRLWRENFFYGELSEGEEFAAPRNFD